MEHSKVLTAASKDEQEQECCLCGQMKRGWWISCETCSKEFCGVCVYDKHPIHQGPSGGDMCKACFDKVKIDDGKTSQCFLCKVLIPEIRGCFSCAWCERLFCEPCFDAKFKFSPKGGEDLCDKCWVKSEQQED